MKEVYKPVVVPGYNIEGYEVSNFGNIRSYVRKGSHSTITNIAKVMNPVPNKNGYFTVRFRVNDKQKTFFVHQLVAFAFLGDRPDGLFVCHNDGHRRNNIVTNLRYDTPANNYSDIAKHNPVVFERMHRKRGSMKEMLLIILGTEWRPVRAC